MQVSFVQNIRHRCSTFESGVGLLLLIWRSSVVAPLSALKWDSYLFAFVSSVVLQGRSKHQLRGGKMCGQCVSFSLALPILLVVYLLKKCFFKAVLFAAWFYWINIETLKCNSGRFLYNLYLDIQEMKVVKQKVSAWTFMISAIFSLSCSSFPPMVFCKDF